MLSRDFGPTISCVVALGRLFLPLGGRGRLFSACGSAEVGRLRAYGLRSSEAWITGIKYAVEPGTEPRLVGASRLSPWMGKGEDMPPGPGGSGRDCSSSFSRGFLGRIEPRNSGPKDGRVTAVEGLGSRRWTAAHT